jgi:hypothetical protein
MEKTNSQTMYDMWLSSTEVKNISENSQKRVIQEIMHDLAPRHDFKKQVELHEKIRNDEDYDDWGYGTEPTYGLTWK